MTKKDYQAIARAIHQGYVGLPTERSSAPQEVFDAIVDCVACVLADDNPRFSYGLFREACETGRTKGMPK